MKLHLPRDPRAPRTARCAVREGLRDRLPGDRIDDAQLLVSELVTNGLRHGQGEIDIEVLVDEEHAIVRCHDGGNGFEAASPKPHADGIGGYGLMLVDRLSDRWGVSNDGRSSCVWFELRAA